MVGLCNIESIEFLVLVSLSERVYTLEGRAIYKINKLHFEAVDKGAREKFDTEQLQSFNESSQRFSRIYTKYGYYCLGGNLSSLFTSMVPHFFGHNTEVVSASSYPVTEPRDPDYPSQSAILGPLQASGVFFQLPPDQAYRDEDQHQGVDVRHHHRSPRAHLGLCGQA